MKNHDYDTEDITDFEELDSLPLIRNMPRPRALPKRKKLPDHKPKRSALELHAELADQADGQDIFNFTYHASRHEREWIVDSLGAFYENRWIDDVLRLLKGGKEATVYHCLANPGMGLAQPYVAAKVYRPRRFRNLKKDHLYREGRAILDMDGRLVKNERELHAVQKRTEFGRELAHSSWIEHEYETLQVLHAAGVDTPAPYERGNNAILMEYIGGPEAAAPTLNTVELERGEARRLFQRVLRNLELMLSNRLVHADLSAFNILYWEGQITLIDFPQAIHPEENRSAYLIFERDVRRVCEYFARQGVRSNRRKLAADLWTAHGYRLAPDVHPRLLNEEDEQDRAYWERIQPG